jgi:hypothetical protein
MIPSPERLRKDYEVFNPGIEPRVSITITFENAADAAWIERAVVLVKRDGQMGRCMEGIVRASFGRAVSVEVKDLWANDVIEPAELWAIRSGEKS